LVLVAHPEFGMGVEFSQITEEQRNRVRRMIATLRAVGGKSPEVRVVPDGMDRSSPGDSAGSSQVAVTRSPLAPDAEPASSDQAGAPGVARSEDALVYLFRHKFQIPVDSFLEQMREQRQSVDSLSR